MRYLIVLALVLIPVVAWGQGPAAISEITDTRNGLGALEVTVSGSRLLEARDGGVMLMFQASIPAGAEVQLWMAPEEGLPWDEREPNRDGLVDSWVMDERTGREVRLKLRYDGEPTPEQVLRYYVRVVDDLYEMLPLQAQDLSEVRVWGGRD
jgi:hypothetical protein